MKHLENLTFTLDNFDGPLDFLLHLLQNDEMDIYEIPVQNIIQQYLLKHKSFLEEGIDTSAEFIGIVSTLLWMKSKMLLPKHEIEQAEDLIEEEADPRFNIIHQLIDYCRFKQVAKDLTCLEEKQNTFYYRGLEPHTEQKKLGIEHLSLQDLAQLFQQLMEKAAANKGIIQEDEWKVSTKILLIRQNLKTEPKLGFLDLFLQTNSRIEMIVTFLAILELMKLGEISVIRETQSSLVWIIQK